MLEFRILVPSFKVESMLNSFCFLVNIFIYKEPTKRQLVFLNDENIGNNANGRQSAA